MLMLGEEEEEGRRALCLNLWEEFVSKWRSEQHNTHPSPSLQLFNVEASLAYMSMATLERW